MMAVTIAWAGSLRAAEVEKVNSKAPQIIVRFEDDEVPEISPGDRFMLRFGEQDETYPAVLVKINAGSGRIIVQLAERFTFLETGLAVELLDTAEARAAATAAFEPLVGKVIKVQSKGRVVVKFPIPPPTRFAPLVPLEATKADGNVVPLKVEKIKKTSVLFTLVDSKTKLKRGDRLTFASPEAEAGAKSPSNEAKTPFAGPRLLADLLETGASRADFFVLSSSQIDTETPESGETIDDKSTSLNLALRGSYSFGPRQGAVGLEVGQMSDTYKEEGAEATKTTLQRFAPAVIKAFAGVAAAGVEVALVKFASNGRGSTATMSGTQVTLTGGYAGARARCLLLFVPKAKLKGKVEVEEPGLSLDIDQETNSVVGMTVRAGIGPAELIGVLTYDLFDSKDEKAERETPKLNERAAFVAGTQVAVSPMVSLGAGLLRNMSSAPAVSSVVLGTTSTPFLGLFLDGTVRVSRLDLGLRVETASGAIEREADTEPPTNVTSKIRLTNVAGGLGVLL